MESTNTCFQEEGEKSCFSNRNVTDKQAQMQVQRYTLSVYVEITRRGIGLVNGASVSLEILESSKIELQEKQEPKTVGMAMGETGIVSSEWKSVGKVKQQKLLAMPLAKDQEYLSLEDEGWLSLFL